MIKNNIFSIEIDEIHLNAIEDIYNSNIEVYVTLEDGFALTIIIGTPKNLEFFIGIHTEGKFTGQIMKAHSCTPIQERILFQ